MIDPMTIPYTERAQIKEELKRLVGKRVRLLGMHNDPDPVTPGTIGTVRFIDDMLTIHVDWDDGRSIGLIYMVDEYEEMPAI